MAYSKLFRTLILEKNRSLKRCRTKAVKAGAVQMRSEAGAGRYDSALPGPRCSTKRNSAWSSPAKQRDSGWCLLQARKRRGEKILCNVDAKAQGSDREKELSALGCREWGLRVMSGIGVLLHNAARC